MENAFLGLTSSTSCGESLYATCCILVSEYQRRGSRLRTSVLEQGIEHLNRDETVWTIRLCVFDVAKNLPPPSQLDGYDISGYIKNISSYDDADIPGMSMDERKYINFLRYRRRQVSALICHPTIRHHETTSYLSSKTPDSSWISHRNWNQGYCGIVADSGLL